MYSNKIQVLNAKRQTNEIYISRCMKKNSTCTNSSGFTNSLICFHNRAIASCSVSQKCLQGTPRKWCTSQKICNLPGLVNLCTSDFLFLGRSSPVIRVPLPGACLSETPKGSHLFCCRTFSATSHIWLLKPGRAVACRIFYRWEAQFMF